MPVSNSQFFPCLAIVCFNFLNPLKRHFKSATCCLYSACNRLFSLSSLFHVSISSVCLDRVLGPCAWTVCLDRVLVHRRLILPLTTNCRQRMIFLFMGQTCQCGAKESTRFSRPSGPNGQPGHAPTKAAATE